MNKFTAAILQILIAAWTHAGTDACSIQHGLAMNALQDEDGSDHGGLDY
ncbi:hypothetical protein [Lignipirellula cremea]|nr:hypothetical protein [Lignipirellula cremea]